MVFVSSVGNVDNINLFSKIQKHDKSLTNHQDCLSRL